MLINTSTSFKKDDIITLKNILGEEIICKYVEESPTHYTIDKPLALGMGQNNQPQFMPVVMTGNIPGQVEFPKSCVMWAVPTQGEFGSQYIQVTTGLAVPGNNQKIIT